MADVRLIDANALLVEVAHRNALDVIPGADFEKSWLYSTVQRDMFNIVKAVPTIDAVPVVHARWVHEQRYGDSGGWVWRCSACRREAISPIISALKYCHSCGAIMDERR